MKARLRSITIQGTLYRWTLLVRLDRAAATESARMQVRIWGHDKAGAPLVVDVPVQQWGTLYVLPSEVRHLIEAGLASGWEPSRHGPPVHLAPEHYQDAIAPLRMRYPRS